MKGFIFGGMQTAILILILVALIVNIYFAIKNGKREKRIEKIVDCIYKRIGEQKKDATHIELEADN